MKTTNVIERLSLFLLALVLTMPTWAQGGSGNESETITIASKEDWKAFCNRVNSGQTTLNAKLTKDVDLGEEIVMAGTADPYYYYFYYYTGTFDGNGHTLKFNWNAGEDNQIAPFYYVENATIKNLRTQGKITTKGDCSSGMVRAAFGTTTITGCISDVDITGGSGGDASRAAGMVQAVADGASVTITDCLVKGSITDNADESERYMAGFVSYNNGTYTLTRCLYVGTNNAPNDKYSYTFGTETGYGATFTDCYYLNTCGKAQGEQVTAERLKSGEMAKLLQGDRTETVWGQTLGTDNEPQLTADAKKRVYEVKFVYNGEVKATRYATNGQSIHGGMPTFTAKDLLGTGYNPHHYYAIAFEGGFNGSTTVNTDRTVAVTFNKKDYYEIASKEDWKAFCDLVNGGQNAIDAKMTKDVDLGEDIAKVGTSSNPYGGTFDGQNHVLTVNWDAGSTNDVAPFGRVKGSTIKNLRTEGSIRSNGYYLSGLIDEVSGENTVTGCVSNVNLTTSYDKSSCDAAGLICYIYSSGRVTISDCLVKGSINATTEKGQKGMGGFVFIQHGSCIMNNCLYAGTNNASGGYTFASDSDPKATTTLNNCHYLNPCGKLQGEPVTKAQLKNGYVAHKLQGTREETVWGQVLGTDTVPLLTDKIEKRVYEVKFTLNNEVKATRYANKGQTVSLPTVQELLGADYAPNITYALSFEGGFSASSTVTGNTTVVANVVFKDISIATKEDWKKFCDIVNSGQNDVNVKMTADVDLGKEVSYVGYYSGTFDGQGHALTIDWNVEYGELAPFYKVNGATIKNLHTKGQITGTNQLSGLIVYVYGNTTISGCVSEVAIKGEGQLAGMIYDENPATDINVTLTDCAVKGDITATTDEGKENMGGFVYRWNGNFTFNNCLYIGTNNASGGYTFSDGANLTNCYYLNSCGTAQGTPTTAEQLKSGEVAKMLQGDRTDQCYWAQTLGETPSPYSEADKAKANYVYYNKESNSWACDDFRLTDGKPLPIGIDFLAAKATYERDFNGAQKATLCLPYELPVQGFNAYTLSEKQGNADAVRFTPVTDRLEAYKPYLLMANGTVQLGGENIQVKAYNADALTTPASKYKFVGTVNGMDNASAAAANAYILQSDGMFHKVTADNPSATIPAYRAYIQRNGNGAKQLSVIIDDETTGIGDVPDGTTDSAVYDLQGRRMADQLDDNARRWLPAGVYIVNGRKIILK